MFCHMLLCLFAKAIMILTYCHLDLQKHHQLQLEEMTLRFEEIKLTLSVSNSCIIQDYSILQSTF